MSRHPRIIVTPGSSAAWRNAIENREQGTKAFLAAQAQRSTVFIDCGANIGDYTCSLGSQFPHLKLIALEPDPMCLKNMRLQARVNKLRRPWTLLGVLSNQRNKVTFYKGEGLFPESGALKAAEGEVIQVAAYTLDDLLAMSGAKDRVLMKIDIEGGENHALRVPPTSQQAAKVIAMAIEVHTMLFPQKFADFLTWFNVVKTWFPATWHVIVPANLQPPAQRYFNRVLSREPLQILHLDRPDEQLGKMDYFSLLGSRLPAQP